MAATNKNIKINLDYSDFTGGIKECNQQMALLTQSCKTQQAQLGNNASQVDKLAIQQQTLTQKIQVQLQIVEQSANKLRALAESESSTAEQVDKAHLAFLKQEETLNKLKNELDQTTQELQTATAEEQKAGDVSTQAAKGIDTFAASFSSTIAVATSLVSALQQVGSAILDVATKSTEWADDLESTANVIGISSETLQKWGYASEFVDTSIQTMQGSMTKMKQNMDAARDGSREAESAFRALGVSVQNSDGSLRNAEQVFYECIDALGQIENSTERDAASMAVFGRSATELNNLIDAGSGALIAYGEQAENLGVIMDSNTVSALAQMNSSFDKLDAVMQAAQRNLSAEFAPAVTVVVEKITNLNPVVLEVVAGVGALLSVASSLAPVLQAIASVTALSTVAKMANAGATQMETMAETGLGAAAMATNTAMLPQILIALALTAALAGLIYLIKELVDALTLESEAADKAAESTNRFVSSAQGAENTTSNGQSSEHHALGGYTRNRGVWVGEQGAEFVELPVGSYVHNATDSRNYSKSTNVFNVTIDAKNVNDFNKVVKVFDGLSQSMNRGGYVNG